MAVGDRIPEPVSAVVKQFDTVGATELVLKGYLSLDGSLCRHSDGQPLLAKCIGLQLWTEGVADALYSAPVVPLDLINLDPSGWNLLNTAFSTQTGGVPAVVTGHFHDPRAVTCSETERDWCEKQFVAASIDWVGAAADLSTASRTSLDIESLGSASVRVPQGWTKSPTSTASFTAHDNSAWTINFGPTALQRYDPREGLTPGYPKASYVIFDDSRGSVVWTAEEGTGPNDRMTRTGFNSGGKTFELTLNWSTIPADATPWVVASYRAMAASLVVVDPTDMSSTEAAK